MNHLPLRRPTVLAMHPDPILCAGLVTALRRHAAFEVFVHGVDDLAPDAARIDVVIADYDSAMRLTDAAAREEQRLPPDVKILAFTSNDREADIRRAIETGVYGYLLVGGPLNELIDGVTAVAGGMRYMSMSVAQRMADSLTRAALTSREIEVLTLVATGQPNKMIARHLSIELGTVKSHVSAIMSKLGASSRTQAARIAASRGLVAEQAKSDPEHALFRERAMEPRMQFA
jgi:DNA-binding NarL/FixJ family response regulator